MCTIAFKPRGVPVPPDFEDRIAACFDANQDGCGYAIKRNGSHFIYVNKGFFIKSDLIREIRNISILVGDEFLFHARIGAGGPVNKDNTQPFYIDSSYGLITSSGFTKFLPVIAHNGTLRGYGEKNGDYSDTANYIKERIAQPSFYEVFLKDPMLFEELLRSEWGWSRFVALYPYRDAYIFSKQDFNEKDGIFYSNYGHQYKRTEPSRPVAPILYLPNHMVPEAHLSINRSYGNFKVYGNGKYTRTKEGEPTIQSEIANRYIFIDKKGRKPRFVFSKKHLMYLLFKSDEYSRDIVMRTRLKARKDNNLLAGEEKHLYRIADFHRTGLLIQSEDRSVTKWINPIELCYNYIAEVKEVKEKNVC